MKVFTDGTSICPKCSKKMQFCDYWVGKKLKSNVLDSNTKHDGIKITTITKIKTNYEVLERGTAYICESCYKKEARPKVIVCLSIVIPLIILLIVGITGRFGSSIRGACIVIGIIAAVGCYHYLENIGNFIRCESNILRILLREKFPKQTVVAFVDEEKVKHRFKNV
jgi:hypothetical protein